jgi:hypothetical protein
MYQLKTCNEPEKNKERNYIKNSSAYAGNPYGLISQVRDYKGSDTIRHMTLACHSMVLLYKVLAPKE